MVGPGWVRPKEIQRSELEDGHFRRLQDLEEHQAQQEGHAASGI